MPQKRIEIKVWKKWKWRHSPWFILARSSKLRDFSAAFRARRARGIWLEHLRGWKDVVLSGRRALVNCVCETQEHIVNPCTGPRHIHKSWGTLLITVTPAWLRRKRRSERRRERRRRRTRQRRREDEALTQEEGAFSSRDLQTPGISFGSLNSIHTFARNSPETDSIGHARVFRGTYQWHIGLSLWKRTHIKLTHTQARRSILCSHLCIADPFT